MVLGENQCYGFIVPPTLGGLYEVANIEIVDIAVYLAVMGPSTVRSKTCQTAPPSRT